MSSATDASYWFREYARLAVSALGVELVATPPIDKLPDRPQTPWIRRFLTTRAELQARRTEHAKELVRFVVSRYQLSLPRIALRFTKLEGHAARIQRRNGIWYLDIGEQYGSDDEQLALIIAHEVAHVLLDMRGVRLSPPQRNEELTDSVSLFAGFGPLMLRAHERKETYYYIVAIREVTTRIGYLKRPAIRYLNRIRQRIVSGEPLRRWASIDVAAQAEITCTACGERISLPRVEGTVVVRCRVCSFPHKLKLRLSPLVRKRDRIVDFLLSGLDRLLYV